MRYAEAWGLYYRLARRRYEAGLTFKQVQQVIDTANDERRGSATTQNTRLFVQVRLMREYGPHHDLVVVAQSRLIDDVPTEADGHVWITDLEHYVKAYKEDTA